MDTESIKGKGVFANPKIDFAFKRSLGNPQYKDATIGLLNAFIPGKNITDVSFANVEFPRETANKKTIYLDIICTDNNGNHFIVEMQRTDQPFFMKRMSYYAARVMTALDVHAGEYDYNVSPCYVIAFLDFDMGKVMGIEGKSMMHFRTVEIDENQEVQHPGSPEFFYFDLTKFNKSVAESSNEMEIWLSLLNVSQDLTEVPKQLSSSRSFAAYFEGLRHANFSDEETIKYDKDMTDEMCWEAALELRDKRGYERGHTEGIEKGRQEGLEEGLLKGREEGLEKGIEKGLQKGHEEERIKIAAALKKQGISSDAIAEATGLSIEEVDKL